MIILFIYFVEVGKLMESMADLGYLCIYYVKVYELMLSIVLTAFLQFILKVYCFFESCLVFDLMYTWMLSL